MRSGLGLPLPRCNKIFTSIKEGLGVRGLGFRADLGFRVSLYFNKKGLGF